MENWLKGLRFLRYAADDSCRLRGVRQPEKYKENFDVSSPGLVDRENYIGFYTTKYNSDHVTNLFSFPAGMKLPGCGRNVTRNGKERDWREKD